MVKVGSTRLYQPYDSFGNYVVTTTTRIDDPLEFTRPTSLLPFNFDHTD